MPRCDVEAVCPHSAPAVAPPGPDGLQLAPSTAGAFTRVLYLVYVLNDVLFRAVPIPGADPGELASV